MKTKFSCATKPAYVATELHTTTFELPEYTIYEYYFTVPLDHGGDYLNRFELTSAERAQLPATIRVFAREFVAAGGEDRPRLVYFQGGPGSAGTRAEPLGGWMEQMLAHYRIVMLDQRGTGQSHAIDGLRLREISSVRAQAAYLSCFRADSIVDDAETLRVTLQGTTPWATLGQSFGGFCITTYLSRAPEGLREAYVTAGLPSTWRPATDVYEHTWQSVEQRCTDFFRRYPQDEETCWRIVEHLAQVPEFLPTGERLTPRRFRTIGINLGWSYGFEKLHHLLEDPFIEDDAAQMRRLSSRFLVAVGAEVSFAAAPLYWALHESIYAQESTGATAWAAQQVRDTLPQFAVPDIALGAQGERDLRNELTASGFGFRFSGEHVFAWQGEEDPALRDFSAAVNVLAETHNLPQLHDRELLATNKVPVAAWIYDSDVFVPVALSLETASEIQGLKALRSASYHHDALRTACNDVVSQLLSELNITPAQSSKTEA